jgi:hypothetical protein
VDEKKSINFPIVNGTLMDTEDDTSSRLTACNRGFLSGFARDIIFGKEDALCGASGRLNDDGRRRESIDDFGGGFLSDIDGFEGGA